MILRKYLKIILITFLSTVFFNCCNDSKYKLYKVPYANTIKELNIHDRNWQKARFDSSFYLTNRPDYWDGETDLSAKFKALWDSTYLYILVSVVDDILFTQKYPVKNYDKDFWRGWDYDCVELYFKTGDLDAVYHHYIFTYSVPSITAGYNYTVNNIQFDFQENDAGYFFIAQIPWQDINFDISDFNYLFFEIQIGDNDKRFIPDSLTFGGMENVMMWANPLPEDYRFYKVVEREKILGKLILD